MSMHSLPLFLVTVCAGLLAWVFARLGHLQTVGRLPIEPDLSLNDGRVTIVVATRDEAELLHEWLPELLKQAGVEKVILVDDYSSDGTLSLAKKVAQQDERLLVLGAPPIPDGWIGKNHALHCAARLARTEYILFTDADTLMAPGTVLAALEVVAAEHLDHLSGYYRIRCKTAGEKVCAPVMAASSAIALFASAASTGSAIGPFNMIRTDFYRGVGGHEQIKNAIVDDVSLARLVRASGGRSMFADMSDRLSIRLFSGVRGFVGSIVRSSAAYLGKKAASGLLGGSVLAVAGIVALLSPLVAAVTMLSPGQALGQHGFVTVTTGLVAYLLGLMSAWRTRRYYDYSLAWTLLCPFAMVLCGLAVAYSAALKLSGRTIRWRGRECLQT